MTLHPSNSEVVYITQVRPPFRAHKFRCHTIGKNNIVQLSVITQEKRVSRTSNIYIQLGFKKRKSTPN